MGSDALAASAPRRLDSQQRLRACDPRARRGFDARARRPSNRPLVVARSLAQTDECSVFSSEAACFDAWESIQKMVDAGFSIGSILLAVGAAALALRSLRLAYRAFWRCRTLLSLALRRRPAAAAPRGGGAVVDRSRSIELEEGGRRGPRPLEEPENDDPPPPSSSVVRGTVFGSGDAGAHPVVRGAIVSSDGGRHAATAVVVAGTVLGSAPAAVLGGVAPTEPDDSNTSSNRI